MRLPALLIGYMLRDPIGSFTFLRIRLPKVKTILMVFHYLFKNFPLNIVVICAIIFSRTARLCWSSLSRDTFRVTKLRSMNTLSPCQTGNNSTASWKWREKNLLTHYNVLKYEYSLSFVTKFSTTLHGVTNISAWSVLSCQEKMILSECSNTWGFIVRQEHQHHISSVISLAWIP